MLSKITLSAFAICGLVTLGCRNHEHHAYRTDDTYDNQVTETRTEQSRTTLTSDRISDKGPLGIKDQQVLNDLHRINAVEIQAGTLAMQKGTADEVRKYGEHLVRDHRNNDRKLEDVARANNFTLSSPRLTNEQQEMIDRLHTVSGTDFDKEFSRSMADAHSKAISKFEYAKLSVSNSDVSNLITETLPVLHHHEQQASQLSNH